MCIRDRSQTIEDLLMAHTESLLDGAPDLDGLRERYGAGHVEASSDLLSLIEQIGQAMTAVMPSEPFVRALRQELLQPDAVAQDTWWQWVRQLPPSVQWAAGIGGAATLTAGVAGVVMIARRPVMEVLAEWRNRRTATA